MVQLLVLLVYVEMVLIVCQSDNFSDNGNHTCGYFIHISFPRIVATKALKWFYWILLIGLHLQITSLMWFLILNISVVIFTFFCSCMHQLFSYYFSWLWNQNSTDTFTGWEFWDKLSRGSSHNLNLCFCGFKSMTVWPVYEIIFPIEFKETTPLARGFLYVIILKYQFQKLLLYFKKSLILILYFFFA